MSAVIRPSTLGTLKGHLTDIPVERPVVAFDGGNRTLQWVDPMNVVHTIPSFIKPIDRSWENVEPDENSVVIDFEGETFVIGQAAKDLGGIAVFQDDKIALAKKLVFAALEPNPGNSIVRVERLNVALPDSRKDEDISLLRAIEGTHEFTRNGQALLATVRRVEAIDETKAAFKFAMAEGLFLSRRNLNGVLDLGGGTSILRLYSTSGALMREADLVLPGTFELAQKIGARLTKHLPYSPDLSLIMDAIAAGDYLYGTTGVCFEEIFDDCRDEWLSGIRAEIKTRWNQWLPSLGEVLIIGGSAPLAQPLVEFSKGRFKIAPNHQTISVVGMVSYGS